jgi:thiamine-phosphate pyrophosphorylase
MIRNFRFNTDLYCITAEEHSAGRSNIAVVEEMIAAGIKIIQYREKDKKMKEKYQECQVIRAKTKEAGVTFIVNDDIDLAILVEADGVHIGQDDLPIDKVRQLVGEEMIIGLSTHSPAQAEEAVARGADYIGVGPIFKTATKKDVCDAVGFTYLEYVVKNIKIPFVAIGGIKCNNIAEVARQGAECIAVVTDITTALDIGARIRELRTNMKKNRIGDNK